MKLLVRNLARNTSEAALLEMFEAFGTVQSCTLVMDQTAGTSKGFGFVEMPREGEAKTAMKTLNGKSVDGQIIRVKKAGPKTASVKSQVTNDSGAGDPLHGITLKALLTELVEIYGWEELARRIRIKCFAKGPSINSSLKFLRKTPWARNKVEMLYLKAKRPNRDIWG
jgi:RNA recognition motif-containing protein